MKTFFNVSEVLKTAAIWHDMQVKQDLTNAALIYQVFDEQAVKPLQSLPAPDELVKDRQAMATFRDYVAKAAALEIACYWQWCTDDEDGVTYASPTTYQAVTLLSEALATVASKISNGIGVGTQHPLRNRLAELASKLKDNVNFNYNFGSTLLKAVTSDLLGKCTGDELIKYGMLSPIFDNLTGARTLTVYPTLEKLLLDAPAQMSVRKVLEKAGIKDESIAKKLDAIVQEKIFNADHVKFYGSDDLDGWDKGYTDPVGFSSCMTHRTDHMSEYTGGEECAYRCYASAAHGLPDNGLVLAVLDCGHGTVARAITYNKDGKNYIVRNYGDDRLERYLTGTLGYEKSGDLPLGTILYAPSNDEGAFLAPYIDGDNTKADYSTHEGIGMFTLARYGQYELTSTQGWIYSTLCELCEHGSDELEEIYDISNNRWINVCPSCIECSDDVIRAYRGSASYSEYVYCYGYPENHGLYEFAGDWYDRDALEYHDLVLTEGDTVIRLDDATYCELSGEWLHIDDCRHVEGEQARLLGVDDDGCSVAEYKISNECVEYAKNEGLYLAACGYSNLWGLSRSDAYSISDRHTKWIDINHLGGYETVRIIDADAAAQDIEIDTDIVAEINEDIIAYAKHRIECKLSLAQA